MTVLKQLSVCGEWMGYLRGLLLVVILFVSTSCKSQLASDLTTLPTPTITTGPFAPQKSATPTSTITPLPHSILTSPTDTPVISPTITPSLMLNHVGPWIFDHLGARVYSLDGGSAELSQYDIANPFRHLAIAPHGGWLAIKPGHNNPWDPEAVYEILLYHLPNNQPVQRILLLGDQAREAAHQIVDPVMGPAVVNSLVFENNMLWSSNARYLAFVGAMDGPSSDLYIYDTYSERSQRLTNEEDQVVLMSWSPDNTKIIYATAEQISDVGFHVLVTVFAVDIESGEITSLYSARAGRESIYGWINTDIFVVGAHNFESPSWGLSLVNITQPGIQLIMDGYYDRAALDPASGIILVEINAFFWNPTIPLGIYRLDSQNDQLEIQIAGKNLHLLGWYSEIGAFIIFDANVDQFIFLNPNGETILTLPLSGDGLYGMLAPSPDGQYILVGGTSLYTLSGELITEWSGSKLLSWLPDSNGVVGVNCSQGFFEIRLSTNDWQPIQVSTPINEYCNYRIVP